MADCCRRRAPRRGTASRLATKGAKHTDRCRECVLDLDAVGPQKFALLSREAQQVLAGPL